MIRFHPAVQCDANEALRHYDGISPGLGDDFWLQVESVCARVEKNPQHFHFDACGWRRASLARFPYHILFYEEIQGVRVMALRHHRRHPQYGTRRR